MGLQNQTGSTRLKPSLKIKAGDQRVLTTFRNGLRGNILTFNKIRNINNK
jgi:hypothetical protein